MSIRQRRSKTAGAVCIAAALLTGCISATASPAGLYATPIGNAPVTANPTPYSTALFCMADYARRYNLPSPRMAVGPSPGPGSSNATTPRCPSWSCATPTIA